MELVSALFLSLVHKTTVNALCESVCANNLQGGEALQGFPCHWVIHKYKLMKLSENSGRMRRIAGREVSLHFSLFFNARNAILLGTA